VNSVNQIFEFFFESNLETKTAESFDQFLFGTRPKKKMAAKEGKKAAAEEIDPAEAKSKATRKLGAAKGRGQQSTFGGGQ